MKRLPAIKLDGRLIPYILLTPLLLVLVLNLAGIAEGVLHGFGAASLPGGRGVSFLFPGGISILMLMLRAAALSAVAALLAAAVALLAARALIFYEFKGRRALFVLTTLPVFVPVSVLGAWIFVFLARLVPDRHMIAAALCTHVILALPFALRILKSVMGKTAMDLEEHARNLGASPSAAFFRGSLPSMKGCLAAAGAIAFLLSLTQYVLAFIAGIEKAGTPAGFVLRLSGENAANALRETFVLPSVLMLLIFFAVSGLFRTAERG
ncbi:MAG: ABC transporter permease subunit [Clostridiales Family XIII bacterium]|jgi:putative spermidine/putrescine transport system permease protein|nr:ABC transporter permease subunit [Clostridiales Family XIII bacterium]